jgi:hypothetical protein
MHETRIAGKDQRDGSLLFCYQDTTLTQKAFTLEQRLKPRAERLAPVVICSHQV